MATSYPQDEQRGKAAAEPCAWTVVRVAPYPGDPDALGLRFDVRGHAPLELQVSRDSLAAFAVATQGVHESTRRRQLLLFLCEYVEDTALVDLPAGGLQGCLDLVTAVSTAASALLAGKLYPRGETIWPSGARLLGCSQGFGAGRSWTPGRETGDASA